MLLLVWVACKASGFGRGGFQGGCLSGVFLCRCACNRHGAGHIGRGHKTEWASFAKCVSANLFAIPLIAALWLNQG